MQQAPDTSSIQEPSKQQHAGSQAGTKVTGISRLLDSNQGLRVPIRDSHCAWVYREYEPQGREREYFLSPSSLSPLVTLQRKTPGGRRRELLLHPARTSLVTSDYARFPYFQVARSAAIHHRLVSLSFFLLRQHARHPSPLRSPRVSTIDALSKRARPFPSLHRHSFLRFSHCPFEGWPLVIVPEPTTTTMMTRTIGEERERENFSFFFFHSMIKRAAPRYLRSTLGSISSSSIHGRIHEGEGSKEEEEKTLASRSYRATSER